ncbi:Uncharacterised protein [Legionella israelensis]|nr:hypothetical protein SAMN02746069_00917 [Legionella israelensis DSM 19235]STX58954.1 Uncharacterised protein [Legionella israelensis]
MGNDMDKLYWLSLVRLDFLLEYSRFTLTAYRFKEGYLVRTKEYKKFF